MGNGDHLIHSFNHTENSEGNYSGLTKREYFAGLAMKGLASNHDWARTMRTPDDWDEYIQRLASGSVEIADALLKELERQRNHE